MYLLFKNNGMFDIAMAMPPQILPDGWFALEYGGEMPEWAWSDGVNVFAMSSPAPSDNCKVENGEWVEEVERSLSDKKLYMIKELTKKAQEYVNKKSGADLVPEFEFATWPIQSSEAQAWAKDKNAETPILDGIAASRGVDEDELKRAALRKSLAYSELSASVAGWRQALQSKIEAAETMADLDKIKIDFV